MGNQYTQNEAKRIANLEKHHLDFSDADLVLENTIKLTIDIERNGEHRKQVFAYVLEVLTVLTVVYTERDNTMRIISFRPAKQTEREAYYEWLNDI